jgi:hypothetical protein
MSVNASRPCPPPKGEKGYSRFSPLLSPGLPLVKRRQRWRLFRDQLCLPFYTETVHTFNMAREFDTRELLFCALL